MSDCKGCPERANPPGVIVEHNEVTRTLTGEHMVPKLSGFPEHENVLYSLRWVIYTGGPPEAHLYGINSILPPEADRVGVTPEGNIKYKIGLDGWQPPNPIDGFRRDAENDYLFLSQWESCTWRHYSISFKTNCKCIDVIARCGKSARLTDFAKCEQCEDRLEIPVSVPPKKKTVSSLRYPEGLPVHNSK